ncbi:MAG: GNVR domain-containing protein, partial [Pseudomonadota bacterium]
SRQIDISEGDGTTPAEQLAALQTRLTSLQARYVDQHPDIVALRDEIRAIEQSMGGNESSTQRLALIQQFLSEEDELQARLARGADAQSIIEAENAVNATRERLQALPVSAEPYEDATTTMLKTQERMSAARQRMALLEQSRQTLINRISDLEGRVAQTPDIQLGIVALSRDIETTQIQYEELRAKELEAQLSQNLEEDSKAERFSLLEPPVRAEFPSKPNRLLIVAAGAMAGIGLGAALTLFLELVFGRVTRPVVIKEIFGAPPLSTIPELYPPQNRSAGSGPTGSAMAQRGSV